MSFFAGLNLARQKTFTAVQGPSQNMPAFVGLKNGHEEWALGTSHNHRMRTRHCIVQQAKCPAVLIVEDTGGFDRLAVLTYVSERAQTLLFPKHREDIIAKSDLTRRIGRGLERSNIDERVNR